MATTDTEITADLVRDLLREQHPDLADLPVRLGARGWDNQLWRLGDDLAVDGCARSDHDDTTTPGPPGRAEET
ncbi:hypothetical protein ACQFYA_16400 [Promicromonospora sp. Marseille-Q5078]